MTQLVKNLPGKESSPALFLGFPYELAGKDLSSIPGLRRSSGEGKRLPTPVFWPGEFHGLYSPWNCKEWDMTE